MGKTTLKTSIKLRRDTINNYSSHATHVPLKGEVCIVDPTATTPWATYKRIRIKIGDGVTSFGSLPFVDQQTSSVFSGYYHEGKFYFDVTHTQEFTSEFADLTKMLFVDLHRGVLYSYDGSKFVASVVDIPDASADQPGIMKLYTSHGYNEDGAMTQKAVTEAIDAIKLAVDEDDPDAFALEKPW